MVTSKAILDVMRIFCALMIVHWKYFHPIGQPCYDAPMRK